MGKIKQAIVLVLAFLVLLGAVFFTGYYVGRSNSSKAGTDTIDTSSIDRITELARSGLIAERQDISRQRAELVSEREIIQSERIRLEQERAISERERKRISTDRTAITDIERLCRETIGIVQARKKSKSN